MAEKDEDTAAGSETPAEDDKTVNDPLTRRDVEAPRKEFEGTKFEGTKPGE